MGSMHVDGVKVDQINNVVMERVEIVEIVEDNAVIMGGSLHESSIIILWDKGGGGSQCI